MMQNYIYEPMWTQELEDYIESKPKLKALVAEMFYKYAMKAYAVSNDLLKGGVLLTTDGLPYGAVKVATNSNFEDEYKFHSPFCPKLRGKDNLDKHTYRSVKLSSLMRVLDKNDVVKTEWHRAISPYVIDRMRGLTRSSIKGVTTKSTAFLTGEELHALLKAVVHNAPVDSETFNKCKIKLDEFDQMDIINSNRDELVADTFANPFYMIAGFGEYGFVISKMRVPEDKIKDSLSSEDIEFIEPWQRVKTIEHYDKYESELAAPITMLKIYNESMKHTYYIHGGFLPRVDSYHEGIGMCSYFISGNDANSYTALVIPTIAGK